MDNIDITALEIAAGEPYRKLRYTKGNTPALDLRPGEDQSFFSNKSMVSFASGISPELRDNILQSTLLAQLSANKKFSDLANMLEWYNAFLGVLAKCGWIIEVSDLQTYEAIDASFEVDSVILDILLAAFGATYIEIIKKTLSAVKNMASNDNKIQAFEKNAKDLSKGFFQIALADETNGVVSMQIGSFSITSSDEMDRVLFFKADKSKTTLQYISRRATFSPKAYETIRKDVEEKLKERLRTDIAEIEI